MTTIEAALREAQKRIAPASESASLDAQVLLAEILGVNRAYLLAFGERELTPEQAAQYEGYVARGALGEPLAYILGRRAFYDREMIVSPAVLIPRPETELLLEEALHFVAEHPQAAAVDVGTGSGALAVTLAAHYPQIPVYAIDISEDALAIARKNAAANKVNVTFLQGDLLQPLIERRIQAALVMANLPYIATDELQTLDVRKFEPHLALDGGSDGLDLIRRLLMQIPSVCPSGAMVLLEIGWTQGEAVMTLARDMLNPQAVHLLKDYAGLDRIVRVIL